MSEQVLRAANELFDACDKGSHLGIITPSGERVAFVVRCQNLEHAREVHGAFSKMVREIAQSREPIEISPVQPPPPYEGPDAQSDDTESGPTGGTEPG